MTKQDIINYVMKTPSNTNESVLKSLLNNIGGSEQGINSMVVHIEKTVIEGDNEWTYTDTLDKTWQEIHDAIDAGTVVFTSYFEFGCYMDKVDCAVEYDNKDGNHVYRVGNYYTSSPDGYPSATWQEEKEVD